MEDLKIEKISYDSLILEESFNRNSYPILFKKIFEESSKKFSYFIGRDQDGKILGVAKTSEIEGALNIHVEMLEVEINHKNMKVGSKLLNHMMTNAMDKSKVITTDGFTGEGKFLITAIKRFEFQNNIKIHESLRL